MYSRNHVHNYLNSIITVVTVNAQSYWSNVDVYQLYPNFTIYDEGWIKCTDEYRAGFAACLSVMESQNKYVGFWSFISLCNQLEDGRKQKKNPFFDEGAFVFGLDRNNNRVPYTGSYMFYGR